jgi:hypothetical protein
MLEIKYTLDVQCPYKSTCESVSVVISTQLYQTRTSRNENMYFLIEYLLYVKQLATVYRIYSVFCSLPEAYIHKK